MTFIPLLMLNQAQQLNALLLNSRMRAIADDEVDIYPISKDDKSIDVESEEVSTE